MSDEEIDIDGTSDEETTDHVPIVLPALPVPNEPEPPAQLPDSPISPAPVLKPTLIIDKSTISQHEILSLPEFFPTGYHCKKHNITYPAPASQNRHHNKGGKSPERYLIIRNHIINLWEKLNPHAHQNRETYISTYTTDETTPYPDEDLNIYLSKSAIRPGLKGMGDVNAISRVHSFLEDEGVINFFIPQRKSISLQSNQLTSIKQIYADEESDSRVIIRRRTRDSSFANLQHDDTEQDELNSEPKLKKPRKRNLDAVDNQFLLIPPRIPDVEYSVPYVVEISNSIMAVIDFHSHLVNTEIIGLLGGEYIPRKSTAPNTSTNTNTSNVSSLQKNLKHGAYNYLNSTNSAEIKDETGILRITTVFPCKSKFSSLITCELDPESEMQAREEFERRGVDVVGWYHSHPCFEPHPSKLDIENQSGYQTFFKRSDGTEPFLCVIASPYNPRNRTDPSKFEFIALLNEWSDDGEYRIPYKCPAKVVKTTVDYEFLSLVFDDLLKEYQHNESKVDFSKPYALTTNTTSTSSNLKKSISSEDLNVEIEDDDEVDQTAPHSQIKPETAVVQQSLTNPSPPPLTLESMISQALGNPNPKAAETTSPSLELVQANENVDDSGRNWKDEETFTKLDKLCNALRYHLTDQKEDEKFEKFIEFQRIKLWDFL
ncbi:hypothetical protein HK098_007945 [Nowakowskiella sp. JEL0407]|nr:hypothetical protein HK098_007945 [Nowakowskiella sp. JEL0407]